jgi:hypothetical protein
MIQKLKNFFIPHEGNNYSPDSLEKGAMFGMLLLVLLSFTATNVFSFLWVNSSWLVGSVLPAVVVKLTNEERQSSALGTLRRNSVLDEAARLKAQDMAKNSYFAHYSPDGVSPWHWFGEANYNFVHAGENLAVHFNDSENLMDAWMESPTHRANIMNNDYAEIGVGTAEGTYEGFKTIYVVQLFGTPAAAAEENKKEVVPEPAATPEIAPAPEQGLPATPTPAIAGEASAVAETPKVPPVLKEVLSESVTLTETVETIPASPVATTVEEKVVEATVVASNTDEAAEREPSQVAGNATKERDSVLYSSFISTSTGGIPATIGFTAGATASTPFYAEIVTQPNTILQILYLMIGSGVFISLMFSIFIEVRRQQPLQIAYGVGLLSLMFGLFYIHSVLTQGVSIL